MKSIKVVYFRNISLLQFQFCLYPVMILVVKFPYESSCQCPLAGWLVSRLVFWLVCHNFLKGQEVTLPCSYRITFMFSKLFKAFDDIKLKMKMSISAAPKSFFSKGAFVF